MGIYNNKTKLTKKKRYVKITDQNFIGSVVIQSFLGEDDDEDSDDDENFDSETIFGLTSAVNISKTQSHGCIEDLRKHILTKSNQFAKQTDKEIFENVLNDETQQIGLIINERFINIPAQISVPMLENLSDEIKHAAVKKPKYDFKHYIMIVKFNRKKGTAKPTNPDDDFYTNGEEEVLDEYANASFEFSVESETDTTLAGNWTEKDSELVPHRKVVIFDANKFPLIINAIKELIN